MGGNFSISILFERKQVEATCFNRWYIVCSLSIWDTCLVRNAVRYLNQKHHLKKSGSFSCFRNKQKPRSNTNLKQFNPIEVIFLSLSTNK